ncbi:hypothetical protein D3C77_423590 [compost metagenome]
MALNIGCDLLPIHTSDFDRYLVSGYCGVFCNSTLARDTARRVLHNFLCGIDHHLVRTMVFLHEHSVGLWRFEDLVKIDQVVRRAAPPTVDALPIITDCH